MFDLDWKRYLWSQCCITSRNLGPGFLILIQFQPQRKSTKPDYFSNSVKDCEYVESKNEPKSKPRLGLRSLGRAKETKSFLVFNDQGRQQGKIVAPNWLKVRTDHDTSGIAPVFEMFNHAELNNAFFDFDPINKKLYVAANRDIEQGDQVFINYSDREDDEMLLHYGFAYPPNENRFSFLEVSKEDLK